MLRKALCFAVSFNKHSLTQVMQTLQHYLKVLEGCLRVLTEISGFLFSTENKSKKNYLIGGEEEVQKFDLLVQSRL